MSTPVTMPAGFQSGAGEPPDVAAYVVAVRAHLSDLQADEIEELTEGLEADLTDARAGRSATPVSLFGDPVDYAAELRSAAGLPPRAASGGERRAVAGSLHSIMVEGRELRRRIGASVQRQSWWPPLQTLVVMLLPIWWLLRGYTAYQAVDQGLTGAVQVLPYSLPTWLALVVLVVGSHELGRRDWAAGIWWRRSVIVIGDLVVVFLICIATILPTGRVPAHSAAFTSDPSQIGLYNGAYQVVNVFPYDRNGKPLQNVQLYDDRGRPIEVGVSGYVGRNDQRVELVPAVDANGRQRTNVYPLRERVTEAGYDPTTGNSLPMPTDAAGRAATLPDPTQTPIIQIPGASASTGPIPSPTPTR